MILAVPDSLLLGPSTQRHAATPSTFSGGVAQLGVQPRMGKDALNPVLTFINLNPKQRLMLGDVPWFARAFRLGVVPVSEPCAMRFGTTPKRFLRV